MHSVTIWMLSGILLRRLSNHFLFYLSHFCVVNETRAVRAMNEALKQNRREQGENSSLPHTSNDRGGALDHQKNVCYLLSLVLRSLIV